MWDQFNMRDALSADMIRPVPGRLLYALLIDRFYGEELNYVYIGDPSMRCKALLLFAPRPPRASTDEGPVFSWTGLPLGYRGKA